MRNGIGLCIIMRKKRHSTKAGILQLFVVECLIIFSLKIPFFFLFIYFFFFSSLLWSVSAFSASFHKYSVHLWCTHAACDGAVEVTAWLSILQHRAFLCECADWCQSLLMQDSITDWCKKVPQIYNFLWEIHNSTSCSLWRSFVTLSEVS